MSLFGVQERGYGGGFAAISRAIHGTSCASPFAVEMNKGSGF